jgi:hypothetical protein
MLKHAHHRHQHFTITMKLKEFYGSAIYAFSKISDHVICAFLKGNRHNDGHQRPFSVTIFLGNNASSNRFVLPKGLSASESCQRKMSRHFLCLGYT